MMNSRPDVIDALYAQDQNLKNYNASRKFSPISRNISRLFPQGSPRPVDAVYGVADLQRKLVLADPELVRHLGSLAGVLSSSAFDKVIDEGGVSYTMLKPHLYEAIYSPLDLYEEEEGALIEGWCKGFHDKGCDVLAQVSTVMTPETFGQFYAGNRERHSKILMSPEDFPSYTVMPENPADRNLFKLIENVMISGPITMASVTSSAEDTVAAWRKILGSSNPAKDRYDPRYRDSFRLLAKLSANTLAHGSGSPEEVRAEIAWQVRNILRMISSES